MWWPPALSPATTGLNILLGAPTPDFANPPLAQADQLPAGMLQNGPWILLPFLFSQQTLIGSSMGEELGWRGVALLRLQQHRSALLAGGILGVVWGVWHLPLYLTRGDPIAGTFFGWMLLGIVADSILFTWVFINTRGILLLALLFHSTIAITGQFLAATPEPVPGFALAWLAVLAIVVRTGAEGPLRREPVRIGAGP